MEEKTLTLGDLHTLLSLIDSSSARGAVRGDEMLTVGILRDKIVQVIQSVEKRIESEKTNDDEVKVDDGE